MKDHAQIEPADQHGSLPAVPQASTRRTPIGPFTARQVGLSNATVVGSALLLFLATRPLGSSTPATSQDPGAAFYKITAETQGLSLGQRAPELVGDDGGKSVQLTDLDGRPAHAGGAQGAPRLDHLLGDVVPALSA